MSNPGWERSLRFGQAAPRIGQARGDATLASRPASTWMTVYGALSVAGTALGAYHGYKRNDSVGWAIGWGILGGMFPIITIPIAYAQGFGKKA